jgi:hypothetical protein
MEVVSRSISLPGTVDSLLTETSFINVNFYYTLDLECLPKTHTLKARWPAHGAAGGGTLRK